VIEQATDSAEQISFGPFRLVLSRKLLLIGDAPVRLGGRAMDILIALLERPGETLSKRDLIARVWPNSFVEEGNLKVHVAALRKAIGDGESGHRYHRSVGRSTAAG
jgi:DNA-binding winged helix-turn-helix (wHTH) protein